MTTPKASAYANEISGVPGFSLPVNAPAPPATNNDAQRRGKKTSGFNESSEHSRGGFKIGLYENYVNASDHEVGRKTPARVVSKEERARAALDARIEHLQKAAQRPAWHQHGYIAPGDVDRSLVHESNKENHGRHTYHTYGFEPDHEIAKQREEVIANSAVRQRTPAWHRYGYVEPAIINEEKLNHQAPNPQRHCHHKHNFDTYCETGADWPFQAQVESRQLGNKRHAYHAQGYFEERQLTDAPQPKTGNRVLYHQHGFGSRETAKREQPNPQKKSYHKKEFEDVQLKSLESRPANAQRKSHHINKFEPAGTSDDRQSLPSPPRPTTAPIVRRSTTPY